MLLAGESGSRAGTVNPVPELPALAGDSRSARAESTRSPVQGPSAVQVSAETSGLGVGDTEPGRGPIARPPDAGGRRAGEPYVGESRIREGGSREPGVREVNVATLAEAEVSAMHNLDYQAMHGVRPSRRPKR